MCTMKDPLSFHMSMVDLTCLTKNSMSYCHRFMLTQAIATYIEIGVCLIVYSEITSIMYGVRHCVVFSAGLLALAPLG